MAKITNIPKRVLKKINIKMKYYFMDYLIFKNVCHTRYNKKVLLLYIAAPFFNRNDTHTNHQVSVAIAQVFQSKGYNVDVAQYSIKRKINCAKYDIVFGFGAQFDKLLREMPNDSKIKTIAFLTGASAYYANVAELHRLAYFRKRNNATLKLRRQDHESDGLMDLEALQNVTAAICTGNAWSVSTWKDMIKSIYHITATGFDSVKLSDINRDVDSAKKNFLWFSGAGMLHKGLDLCIEAFRGNRDLHLYIAGVKDPDFYEFYKGDFESENIHYCGFINVKSEKYRELCEKCLFCIFPSCSEGGATSVLTTMFSGMIPIVTETASVDIEDWGILIKCLEIDYLASLIRETSGMNNEDLRIREKKAYRYAMENHSIEKFSTDFSKIIDLILSAL